MTKNERGLLAKVGEDSKRFLDDVFSKFKSLSPRGLAYLYSTKANESEKQLYDEHLRKSPVRYQREFYEHLTEENWRTNPR